ncbi:hypothetical protein Ddye_014035 [Dipteronia dyeriana]|uniref:Reverse transcriptase n=1 Tax=Dipteronia dyeriana TaxID=168575 RepID=A0AAD9X7H1_9ROSI|nr:hypothetical protein Ddye_014035 [Dipteronia dyeriana]
MPLIKNLERNIVGLLAREEVYWKQRSRAGKLDVGDRHMIFDNVIASFEILHSTAYKNSGKKGLMALKLDMSKTYVKVE